jgi:hypothetical protein
MEKKLTNSGPLMEPADKHSIYTIQILAAAIIHPDFRAVIAGSLVFSGV